MLRTLFDQEQRIHIEFPHAVKEIHPHFVRFLLPAPGMNFILYTNLDQSNADQAIREQVEFFSQLERPVSWKVYDYDQPPDLKQRLLANGFQADEEEAVMVLDLAASAAEIPMEHSTSSPELDVRRLQGRAQLGDVVAVLEQVWEGKFDWVWERLGGHMEIPGYLSVYVAYVDEKPASCGWTYFSSNSQFASLWGGSTIKAQRGKGLYRTLLSARLDEIRQRGRRYAVVDCSPMSQPIVTRFGFKLLATAQDFEWKPREER